jgi:hypothetical protein
MVEKAKKRRKNGVGFKGTIPDVGKATQFKAGNPGGPGRPKTAKFADAARHLSAEVRKKGKREITGAQELAEVCFERAIDGSARHAEIFLNYSEGKPHQAIALSVPDGFAMRFENMTAAEIDARLEELLRKFQEGKRDA